MSGFKTYAWSAFTTGAALFAWYNGWIDAGRMMEIVGGSGFAATLRHAMKTGAK